MTTPRNCKAILQLIQRFLKSSSIEVIFTYFIATYSFSRIKSYIEDVFPGGRLPSFHNFENYFDLYYRVFDNERHKV